MEHIDGNMKEWIRMERNVRSYDEICQQLDRCNDMRIAISRALYLIDENAYRNATCKELFDGFCIKIKGYYGDVACHEGTIHNYETIDTVADYDDVTRTLNPIEALMNILRSPVSGKRISKKQAAIKVLKALSKKHGNISESDATLMRWAMIYAIETLEDE